MATELPVCSSHTDPSVKHPAHFHLCIRCHPEGGGIEQYRLEITAVQKSPVGKCPNWCVAPKKVFLALPQMQNR